MLHGSQIFYLLLLLVLHNADAQEQLFEGDVCQEAKDGTKHICKKLQDCQSAFDMIRSDDKPKICSYNGFTVIVCCKPDENSPSTAPPANNPTLPPIEHKNKKPLGGFKTISEKKCDEYKNYVYQKSKVTTLAIGIDEEDEEDDGTELSNRSKNKKKEDTCGITPEPLIVDGKPVAPREFPHQVNIGYKYGRLTKWLCTGSLISENFVLSAAHCSRTNFGQPKVAVIGDLDIDSNDDDAKPVELRIVQIIDHPLYASQRPYHDIALYRLEKNVTFDGYKRPACLNTNQNIKETKGIATGWGNIRSGGPGSSHLMKVKLDIIPNDICSQYWFKGGSLKQGIKDEEMICAGDLKGIKDTCQGDSGGPFQIPLTNPYCMYSIIGVTSFGKSCGIKVPGVYTRVSQYVPWIERIVWPNE